MALSNKTILIALEQMNRSAQSKTNHVTDAGYQCFRVGTDQLIAMIKNELEEEKAKE